MNDYHLRFIDRQQAAEVLAAAGISENPTHDTAVDHVGEVVLVPAVMDGDEELEPAVIDTRHHVNLRTRTPLTGSQLAELADHLVYPVNPVRVWA